MAKFLVTYHGSEMPHDPEAMAKARDAFMQWAANAGSALVEPGAPVRSARSISSSGSEEGPATGPFTGWSVIEAADVGEAAELLADHPFIARGGILQVSEPVEF
jgi:hypothetical protein